MIDLLKRWFGSSVAHEAGAHVIIRGARMTSGYSIDVHGLLMRSNLKGWMRASDSFIEMDIEGSRKTIDKILLDLQQVPIGATVRKMEVSWKQQMNNYTSFRARH